MRRYEYKVVPVPEKCLSSKDAAAADDPAAFTVEVVLNDMAVEGWIYIRTDRMTMQKAGILGQKDVSRDMMVFRRQPVGMADHAPVAPVSEREPLALLPAASPTAADEIGRTRARRVQRPEMLAEAKAGRRRVAVRPAAQGYAGE